MKSSLLSLVQSLVKNLRTISHVFPHLPTPKLKIVTTYLVQNVVSFSKVSLRERNTVLTVHVKVHLCLPSQGIIHIDVSAAEKLQTFTVETENSLKPADQLDKLLKTVYQICSSFFEETKRNLPRKQKSREEAILDQEKHECRLEMKQLRQELRKSGPSIENAVKY